MTVAPRVSVIIPCYNQGAWLDEAVESVLAQTYRNFEIIVVNDGSTDPATVRLLERYERPHLRVIHTHNQGLAMARNNGIAAASGEFILPLDADDAIAPSYLEEAVPLLEQYPRTGIVYCLGETFGAVNGPWFAPPYSLRHMLLGNLIFCSALFRREDWQAVGGYKSSMAAGYEDWDFWLSLIGRGREVQRIPKTLFRYRVKECSMAASMDWRVKAEMHHRIMLNHRDLYLENMKSLLELYYRMTGSRPYRLLKRLGMIRRLNRLWGG